MVLLTVAEWRWLEAGVTNLNSIAYCVDQLVDAVVQNQTLEVTRLSAVLGFPLDCQSYEGDRLILQLALSSGSEAMALQMVQSYSPSSPQLSTPDSLGNTPILNAAGNGYASVVGALLDQSADATVVNKRSQTVLHMGAPWPAVVTMLMSRLSGLSEFLTHEDQSGNLPLHLALKAGSTASAQSLINGASKLSPTIASSMVSQPDADGNLPVDLTSDLPTLQLLQSAGGSLTAANSNGVTPLQSAAGFPGSVQSMQYLLAAAQQLLVIPSDLIPGSPELQSFLKKATQQILDTQDNKGWTALHYAANAGDPVNFGWLLSQGANSGLQDVRGNVPLLLGFQLGYWALATPFAKYRGSPLFAIIQVGSLDLLKQMVLTQGFDPDVVESSSGQTPLFQAAKSGSIAAASFLLDRKAQLGRLDKFGNSVLSTAAAANQSAIVLYLAGAGASVTQRLPNGTTALHLAARAGYSSSVQALLASGAGVNATDEMGFTPLHYASSAGAVQVLLRARAGLIAAGGQQLLPIHTAAEAGASDAISALLRTRLVDVGATDAAGNTALHHAVIGGSAAAIRSLLHWCAGVAVANSAGQFPYQLTANASIAELARGGPMTGVPCDCDCGPYMPSPLVRVVNALGNCTLSVRCALSGPGGPVESVQCLPGVGGFGFWSPAAPRFPCAAGGASPRHLSWVTALAVAVLWSWSE